jgi:hypothetical protein
MSAIAAELCDYRQFYYLQANRLKDFKHAVGELTLWLVLDHQSPEPVAKCAIEQLVYYGREMDRECVFMELPSADGPNRFEAGCFKDGYWDDVKSPPLLIDEHRAIYGCIIPSQ